MLRERDFWLPLLRVEEHEIAKPQMSKYTWNRLLEAKFDFSAIKYSPDTSDFAIFTVLKKSKFFFMNTYTQQTQNLGFPR